MTDHRGEHGYRDMVNAGFARVLLVSGLARWVNRLDMSSLKHHGLLVGEVGEDGQLLDTQTITQTSAS